MSPNIDQNSWPKERAKKDQLKYLISAGEYPPTYKYIFPVNENIARRVKTGGLVKTTSKTIIMK
jgi:hypothetical protein